ncbi:MAG: glycosyltransferase [Bacteroidota bacterium]
MSMTLTVVIPTHGRPSLLARTLASVAACARPSGYGGCVVVENGPPAGAAAVVAEAAATHPEAGFRYLHHARANKSAALTAALAALAASGSTSGPASDPEAGVSEAAHLAVFLDDDVRVSPGVLLAYAEAAAAHPKAAYFGGPVACDYEERPPEWLRSLLPMSARGLGEADAERQGYFLGFNWAAWAGEVASAGGFDPAYGPGSPTGARGQESDMQRRLRAAGARQVFVADAEVHHFVPVERCTPAWAVQRAYHSAERLGHIARHAGGRRDLRATLLGVAWHPLQAAVGTVRADERLRTEALASLAYDIGYLKGFFLSGPPTS